MRTPAEIDHEYSQMCALLGDAIFTLGVLEERIKVLKAKLGELNAEKAKTNH